MKLSARARYAVSILLELSHNGKEGPVTASALSKQTGISSPFIEQILRPLRQAGITSSVRGVMGGHILAQAPQEISIGDIIRIMEGGVQLSACKAVGPDACGRFNKCPTRDAWNNLSKTFEREMDRVSLGDLLENGTGKELCPLEHESEPATV